jgi:3-hydroxyacyl-[acyl-carrier-protein] dehydratase
MRFVLIDRLLAITPWESAVAAASFSNLDDVVADHFPGRPLVPGVLITEAMCQTAGWLIAASVNFARWPLLASIDQAKFHRPLTPGETTRVSAALRGSQREHFEVGAHVDAGETRIATARLLFHASDITFAGAGAAGLEGWGRALFRDLGGEDLLVSSAPPDSPSGAARPSLV